YFLGTASTANRTVVVDEVDDKLNVTVDGTTSVFNKTDVKFIAGFFGSGNDVYINNSSIDSVFYGAAGNDVLVGGTGFDKLKGSGGQDVLDGRGGANDLTGNGDRDFLIGGGRTVIRADALDVVLAVRNDLVLNPDRVPTVAA
ncbi:MAG: hypothetical protein ACRC1K_27145, partial [Planctomycetia bacterium]